MIKKIYHGTIHKSNAEEESGKWFFHGLNTKVKKIEPQKQSKKSRLWSFLFLVVNIVVLGCVLIYQINSEEGVPSISNLFRSEHNAWFVIVAVGCFLISELLIAIKLNYLTRRFNKKGNFWACLKAEFVCQYYSKITPFSMGGQPFEVYELNRHGIKANNALTVVSCNYVSHKLVYWVVSLFMMITIGTNNLVKNMSGKDFGLVLILALISLCVMSVYIIFIILICLNKKIASKLIDVTLRLLNKLKIIKNRKLVYFKIMRPALSFQHKMKEFFKSKKLAMLTLLFSLCIYLIQSSIPACIYFIFKPFNFMDLWRLVSIAVVIQLSFGVNPLPGGSGVAEISFYAVFSFLLEDGLVFWALIIWRILTYYIYLVTGFGLVVYDYAYGNKKLTKKRRNIKINE